MAIVDGYATLPEVKAELRLTTTVDDARIERAVEAASRLIDNVTGRRFVTSTGPRVFRGWGSKVFIGTAQSVTLVEESNDQTNWSTVTSSAYVPNAGTPIQHLTRLDGGDWAAFVRVTSSAWDTATVPAEVHEACIIQAVRLFKRADTPEGVLTGDFGAARLARIDPDVLALIRPLARQVVG